MKFSPSKIQYSKLMFWNVSFEEAILYTIFFQFSILNLCSEMYKFFFSNSVF